MTIGHIGTTADSRMRNVPIVMEETKPFPQGFPRETGEVTPL